MEREAKYIGLATQIGDAILGRRIFKEDNSFIWTGPKGYGTPDSPLVIREVGPHLYDGVAGISLFLSALAHITKETRFKDASIEALAPLRDKLKSLIANPARARQVRMSVGGLFGLGSIFYSLAKIGRLLDVSEMLSEAHDATCLLADEVIARDNTFRFQKGCAGAILNLLALTEDCERPNARGITPLELAERCSMHLMTSRTSFEGRPKSWAISPGWPSVCDFCYGSSGIRYALLRLYEKLSRPYLWEVAEEALAFERSLYSEELRGWLDPRFPGKGLQAMWCHGTAGIALGKIALLHLFDDPETQSELKISLDATLSALEPHRFQGNPYDDMCCGHMGRVEVLCLASQYLGDALLLETAHNLAERVLERAHNNGYYGITSARGTDAFDPSLFQGVAGIGYVLLRLACPDVLPSLLLLD